MIDKSKQSASILLFSSLPNGLRAEAPTMTLHQGVFVAVFTRICN
jgi:hypothetical protein